MAERVSLARQPLWRVARWDPLEDDGRFALLWTPISALAQHLRALLERCSAAAMLSILRPVAAVASR